LPAFAGKEAFSMTSAPYRSECGSCHVAYPPALLDAQAWASIMARLDRHFGLDASADARTTDEIRTYLVSGSGRRQAVSAAMGLPRISDTRWFLREHYEVPRALWTSKAVKSPANCGACHTRAEQGDFSERTVRLPE
jgi:hypothetical protein